MMKNGGQFLHIRDASGNSCKGFAPGLHGCVRIGGNVPMSLCGLTPSENDVNPPIDKAGCPIMTCRGRPVFFPTSGQHKPGKRMKEPSEPHSPEEERQMPSKFAP